MLYIGGREVKQVWAGGRPAAQAWCGGRMAWGGEPAQGDNFFTVAARGDTLQVACHRNGNRLYSTDGGSTWNSYAKDQVISVGGAGSTVKFKADGQQTWDQWKNYGDPGFSITGYADLSGDVTTLWDPEGGILSCPEKGLMTMFASQPVVDASGLEFPMLSVGSDGLGRTFAYCDYLVEPPKALPATRLMSYSYSNMFINTGIKRTPAISATQVTNNSFSFMVYGTRDLSCVTVCLTGWSNMGEWWDSDAYSVRGKFYCPTVLGTDSTIERSYPGQNSGRRVPYNWLVGNFDLQNPQDISTAALRYASADFTVLYDGASKAPSISSVSAWNGKTLEPITGLARTDSQTYYESGTWPIWLSAPGYDGRISAAFTIVTNSLESCDIEVGRVYNGQPAYVRVYQPTLGIELQKDVDYGVAVYSSSIDETTVLVSGIEGGAWTGQVYFTFSEDLQDGPSPLELRSEVPFKLAMQKTDDGAPDAVFQWSQDGVDWNELPVDTQTPTMDPQYPCYLRARDLNQRLATSDYQRICLQVDSSKPLSVSGNVVSLLDRAEQLSVLSAGYSIGGLFYQTDNIGDASGLCCSAKRLNGSHAMSHMFDSCYSLYSAPTFDGISVGNSDYINAEMFQACSNLSSVSYRLAWPLAKVQCDYRTFANCDGLLSAVVMSHFGDGVATPTAASYSNFGRGMFSNCYNLSSVSTDLTAWPSGGFPYWLDNVAASGEFHCPTALGDDQTIQRGSGYCPAGWTVVNTDA